MGRPVARNLEDEMMTKIKALFDRILETVNKENPSYTFDFEQFVDCFDENDHFTKRVFEFLVKETAQRYRSAHPQAQNPTQPRTVIHHYLGQDGSSTTDTTAPSSNPAASTTTGSTPISSATSLRPHHHHHHHHSPFQQSRHSLPSLERDSLARSPSGFGMNENAQATTPSTNSSGAALRYLLSSQGFGQNSRRSRMAQRMLSNDLLAFHQGQPTSFISSLSAFPSPSGGSNTNRGSGSVRRTEQETDTSPSGTAASPSSSSAPTAVVTTNATASRQDHPRRHVSLREISMEFMPESLRNTDADTSGSSFQISDTPEATTDPALARAAATVHRRRALVAENIRHSRENQMRHVYAQTLRGHPVLQLGLSPHDQFRMQQIRQQFNLPNLPSPPTRPRPASSQASPSPESTHEQLSVQQFEQLRQLEQSQHAHQQALQALQGQRLVAPENDTTASQIDSPSTAQPLSQQNPLGFAPQDNGLRLVQPYPGSPGTPVPISNMPSESTTAAQSTTLISTSHSQAALDEAYQEFANSSERGRAAMRNALAADLHIEEDHQVLLTGEVSRRRRRRVVGRFTNSIESPDIGSDNSSAIISQQQQQQEQQQQQQQRESATSENAQDPTIAISADTSTTFTPANSTTLQVGHNTEQLDPSLETNTVSALGTESSSVALPTTTSAPIAVETVPEVAAERIDGQVTHEDTSSVTIEADDGRHGLGLTSASHTSQGQSVPPTPPSPNPNRNPMPTFLDRRRSSINPADIETLAREMEANAQSAALGIRTTTSNNRPSSMSSPRIRFSLHALSPIAEPGGSTPSMAHTPPLGILAPSTTDSNTSILSDPTGSLATQQQALLSPEPEGTERISGSRSPSL